MTASDEATSAHDSWSPAVYHVTDNNVEGPGSRVTGMQPKGDSTKSEVQGQSGLVLASCRGCDNCRLSGVKAFCPICDV